MLQEDYLKLNRMLDRVAIIFHVHRLGCGGSQFVNKFLVCSRGAVGSDEIFLCQSEAVGRSVVRSAKNDESAPIVAILRHRLIGRPIGIPTAIRTGVRRRDSHGPLLAYSSWNM